MDQGLDEAFQALYSLLVQGFWPFFELGGAARDYHVSNSREQIGRLGDGSIGGGEPMR